MAEEIRLPFSRLHFEVSRGGLVPLIEHGRDFVKILVDGEFSRAFVSFVAGNMRSRGWEATQVYVTGSGLISDSVISRSHLECNLTLFALAARTSDLVFVNQVLALDANTVYDRKLVSIFVTVGFNDKGIAV